MRWQIQSHLSEVWILDEHAFHLGGFATRRTPRDVLRVGTGNIFRISAASVTIIDLLDASACAPRTPRKRWGQSLRNPHPARAATFDGVAATRMARTSAGRSSATIDLTSGP